LKRKISVSVFVRNIIEEEGRNISADGFSNETDELRRTTRLDDLAMYFQSPNMHGWKRGIESSLSSVFFNFLDMLRIDSMGMRNGPYATFLKGVPQRRRAHLSHLINDDG
jgi:hypothetical protein